MADDNKTVENKTEQAPDTETDVKAKNWEKIGKDAQRRADEATAKLKAYEQKREDDAKAAETKRLEAIGEYKTIIANKEAEYEAKLAAMRLDNLRRDLKDRLRTEAVSSDEIFLRYAAEHFSGKEEDIAPYIDAMKTDSVTAKYFSEPVREQRPGAPPPPSAPVKGARSLTLEDRLKSDDKQVRLAALKEQFEQAVR
jgi:hypothetical protein